MRRAKGIYPLLLITIFASMVSFAFASISFDGGGIKYVAANKGDILFSIDYGASKMYFDNGFLMLNNLNGLFSSIGFSCDTESANMTITKIESDELDYTVNAPTDVTSTTKIYVGSKGEPSGVSGATSWYYNSNLKIVTVNVLHQSPSNIIIEWTTGSDSSGGVVFYPDEEEEEQDAGLGAKIKELKEQIDALSGIQGIIRDVGTVGLTGIAVYILWLKRKRIMSFV